MKKEIIKRPCAKCGRILRLDRHHMTQKYCTNCYMKKRYKIKAEYYISLNNKIK